MSVIATARPRFLLLILTSVLVAVPLVAAPPARALDSASMSGTVTDAAGRPVAGVSVEVTRYGGEQTAWTTDGEGRYTATGLVAGTYTVCFWRDGVLAECWEDVEPGDADFRPVVVGEDEHVTGIDAALEDPSHLRGKVTDARGEPVPGIVVSASWHQDDLVLCCSSAVTAADGSFDVEHVHSGSYTLLFSDRQRNRYASEWWKDAGTQAAATRVVVARGESVDHLDAVLADLPHVTGRVTGVRDVAVADAVVRVYAVGGGAFREVTSAPVSSDGTYDVGGLQPGTYRLGFDAAPGRYRTEYWDDARTIGSARDVVVTSTTVTDVDARLGLAPAVQVTRAPAIRGRAAVGERLRATTGDWDVRRVELAYQWRADGAVIPGATDRTLRLTPRLRGQHLRVRVTAAATHAERSPGVAWTGRTPAVAPVSPARTTVLAPR